MAFADLTSLAPVLAASSAAPTSLGQVKQVRAGALDVGYYEFGPGDGPAVLLLHGYPYDVHAFVEVAPLLAARGNRVIVPHLRGHGTTTVVDAATPRSGQQAALGVDTTALMDALDIRKAVLAGYDWGGRAACVVAALWPERCTGLVSGNGYLIQDIAHAETPIAAKVEHALWYQYYFTTERGKAGLAAHRDDIARILWTNECPTWHFDDATFERSAASFDNPDYVDVVIHSYRHRLGLAPGYPQYAGVESQLATLPIIRVPAITLDGATNGVIPPTDGKWDAAKYASKRIHRVIPNAGHNLPQEAPQAFADAVTDVATLALAS
jgi:pimeloyl-ACP methyl ester carboxylesterase